MNRMQRMASSGWRLLRGKLRGYALSAELLGDAAPMKIGAGGAAALREGLSRLLADRQANGGDTGNPLSENADDKAIVAAIRAETDALNRNNVTRTEAYWRLYSRHPELHWALLAHMVSRNGGWAMTDLRGELLSRLITPAQSERMFQFLERANALIFRDAYPQLMLYAEGRKRGVNLTRLLPYFNVSAFMTPVWEHFLKTGDSVPLTIGLIVNEQNYIEGRVVQNKTFREELLDTSAFHAYAWLQLTQVLFPYDPAGKRIPAAEPRLAGLVLESFSSLEERIGIGKKLYALLFGVPAVREGVLRFAGRTPHTGTRADYWPQLFSAERACPDRQARYVEQLSGTKLRPGAKPLYSPALSEAWPDQRIAEPQRYDWFCDHSGLAWFEDVSPPFPLDMTSEACFGLGKLELAVIAAEALHDEKPSGP